MVSKRTALALLDGQHSVKTRVAANVLGFQSTASIRNLCRDGTLKTERIGKREFVTVESILAILNAA